MQYIYIYYFFSACKKYQTNDTHLIRFCAQLLQNSWVNRRLWLPLHCRQDNGRILPELLSLTAWLFTDSLQSTLTHLKSTPLFPHRQTPRGRSLSRSTSLGSANRGMILCLVALRVPSIKLTCGSQAKGMHQTSDACQDSTKTNLWLS